ncbi:MAG: FecR family protein [Eubacteriales bacterium]
MKKISILLVIAMLFSLFSTCAFANDNVNIAGTLAKIAEIRGDASIVNDAAKKTMKAFKNMKLSEGDTVVTTKDAQVRLFLENKILVIVEGNSEVVVSKNSKNKVTQGYERLLDLKKGSLVVIADKKLQNQEKLEVKTQTMVAGVRGTSFGIVNKPDHYYIEVYEGVVQLAPNKEYYANDSAISNLKPILITKQRTKLIKYGNFVNDYRLEPKKTQEPLIYPNTLLRFKEEEKYYGKYMAGQKQDMAIKPDSAKTMTSRMGEVLGYNFTFERAYDFNKKENIVAKNTSTSSNPSSRPEPQTPPSLPSINYYNELVFDGNYTADATISGGIQTIKLKITNGKINDLRIPTLTHIPNNIGLAAREIESTNIISSALRQSEDANVKQFVEGIIKAINNGPFYDSIPVGNGQHWYGYARGNERYDWLRPSGTHVGPMAVKISVTSNNITAIEHKNFGDADSLRPASGTYAPIRNAVVHYHNTDLVKKAILHGANASGLSDSEKATARDIYSDVINGATSSEEIKKRQKSAIGYVNAIENAIQRSRSNYITVNSRKLLYLAINPVEFENKVFYKSASDDLSNVNLPASFIDDSTGAVTQGTVTLANLADAGIEIKGDAFSYNSANNKLTHTKSLSDYSAMSKFDLSFTHPSGFEYATMIPVVRGVDTAAAKIPAKKLIIGKNAKNYEFPLWRRGGSGSTIPSYGHNYLIREIPDFMNSGNFDVLKILGENGAEFDLTKGYNKNPAGKTQIVVDNNQIVKNTHDFPNFKLLNNPLPQEPAYRLSEVYGNATFLMNLIKFGRIQKDLFDLNLKIVLTQGDLIDEGQWNAADPSGTGPQAVIPLQIYERGNSAPYNQFSKSSLREWGFFTEKYFDKPVSAADIERYRAAGYSDSNPEKLKLYIRVWNGTGVEEKIDTKIELPVVLQ